MSGLALTALTTVDTFFRESPTKTAGSSVTGRDVVRVIEHLAQTGRCCSYIVFDNGSELIPKASGNDHIDAESRINNKRKQDGRSAGQSGRNG